MQTKIAAFRERVEKLTKKHQHGLEMERLLIAISAGMNEPGRGTRKHEGGALEAVYHLARLLESGEQGDRRGPYGFGALELAHLAEQVDLVLDAVNRELDHAEADIARRAA